MKTYLFYTPEGYNESPNHAEVYTLQILGYEQGRNEEEAKLKLLDHNTWIQKGGFNPQLIRWHTLG